MASDQDKDSNQSEDQLDQFDQLDLIDQEYIAHFCLKGNTNGVKKNCGA